MFIHKTFNRNMGEQRIPFAENQCLPESSHPAIAVFKRMDELKLVMKNRAGNQRVLIGCL